MLPPTAQPYAESAASLARTLAAAGPRRPRLAAVAAPVTPAPPPPQARRLPWLVAGLLLAAAAVGMLAPRDAITERPLLALLLIGFVLVFDFIRIDVFERSNVSPASVPALALAFIFGPLGPIAAEVAIALTRIARREPVVKWTFDLGALSLAGAAAAGVYALIDPAGAVWQVAAGVAAAVPTYVISAGLVSVVMWFVRGEKPVAAWREQFAWLWPHYLAFGTLAAGLVVTETRIGGWAVLAFGVPVLMLWLGEEQYLSRSREGVRTLRERNSQLQAAHDQIQEMLESAHSSYLQTITTLGRAVQARDEEAAIGTERVARLARLLGAELGLSPDEVHAINVGVVIHDIGKIALPDARPADPRVPALSAHILSPLDLPDEVMAMARHHMERYDGTGLPDGLAGEDIPLAVRVLAVARAFDHHTSTAASPMTFDTAIATLRVYARSVLCPRVIDALERCLNADPALRRYFGNDLEVSHAA